MWRSPDTAPLDAAEMARVHRLHDWLRAVKECLGCEQLRPIAEFARYGNSFCSACRGTVGQRAAA